MVVCGKETWDHGDPSSGGFMYPFQPRQPLQLTMHSYEQFESKSEHRRPLWRLVGCVSALHVTSADSYVLPRHFHGLALGDIYLARISIEPHMEPEHSMLRRPHPGH